MSAEQGKIGLLILTHCEVGVGLLESVPSQENSQNGQISQSARWIVSMTQTMQLTTRSLKPYSVSLQSLSIFLSVDCRKADFFRHIYMQSIAITLLE